MKRMMWILMVVPIAIMHSCVRDYDSVGHEERGSKITLSIDSEDMNSIGSKAGEDQSVISDVHFLLFDGAECVEHVYVENGYSAQIEMLDGVYMCYAVTNTGQSDLFGKSTTIDQLEYEPLFVLPKKDYWDAGSPKPAFVMGGKKELEINSTGGIYQIPVYRVCAQIDVVITVDIMEGVDKYHYTFEEISLEGYPMKTTYCPNEGDEPDDVGFRILPFTDDNGVVTIRFHMIENLSGGRLAESEVSEALKEKYPDAYAVDDQRGKRKYAPESAAYLAIRGHAVNDYNDDINTMHYVYLGRNNSNDYNVGRNENHKYTVNINGIGDLGVDTRVTAIVDQPEFSNLDPANCYMIHSSGNYFIPATFLGNRTDMSISKLMEDIDIDISTIKAEFLWSDNKDAIWLETIEYADHPDQVTYPGEKIIKFRVKGDPERNEEDRGNTVIALYGYESGDVNRETPIILWSWHLWFTDTPKEVVTGGKAKGTIQYGISYPATDGTLIIMDRNLGATAAMPEQGELWRTYGCHYQMGRKDPFPNAKRDGVWFNYNKSSEYDLTTIGESHEHIRHLKFSEATPFAEFSADAKSAFNEKLAPDKTIGFEYLPEGISGIFASRHPMVFASKFQDTDTRWTDKAINDAINDPLYNVSGAKEDYWNREKTVHDPCPSGWTILGISGSFWNQNAAGLEEFQRDAFTDMNGNNLGGVYSQMPGTNTDKVWWPSPGVRSVYGRLANTGQTAIYFMFDHIDHPHGAHVARFLLNEKTIDTSPFAIQGKDPTGSITVNGMLAQINVGGEVSSGTNQAGTIRCVKADQDINNLNDGNTRSALVKMD